MWDWTDSQYYFTVVTDNNIMIELELNLAHFISKGSLGLT